MGTNVCGCTLTLSSKLYVVIYDELLCKFVTHFIIFHVTTCFGLSWDSPLRSILGASHCIGRGATAYSSLEMANGDTIVSTGIAPAVLVCIRPVQSRLNLTAVPLMRGFDMVLGKDWLDRVNPLIEWRHNRLYIKQGDQLHILSGDPNVQPCGIKDQGLPGL